jgi:uncharacterized RDD family membrane protein YckC
MGIQDSTVAGIVPEAGTSSSKYAHFALRVIAFVVDELVLVPFAALGYLLISQGGAGYITGGVSVFAYGQAMAFYNRCVLMGETGQSWGKLLTRTKLISIRTGEPLGVGRTIVRDMCHAADFVPLIGSFFPLFDRKRQTFADKIAGSVVVNVQPQAAPAKSKLPS